MRKWKLVSLGDISSDINYGYTTSANYKPIGPRFLRITDIANGRLNWDSVPFCEISDSDFLKYKLNVGDIVIARTGATTGATYTIKQSDPNNVVFASYLIRYKIDSRVANPFFVDFCLRSEAWKSYVESISGGSAQPGANAKQLATFEIELPPLFEQNAIVEVLSSLDNKIDLLHRQNKTLESLAETLFRQWFIEETAVVSEGQIALGDLINTVSETHKFPETEIVFLNTSDVYLGEVLNHNMEQVSALPGQAKKSIRRDDILFSEIRPENGRYAYIDFDAENYVVSTKLMVLRSKKVISQAFIYFFLTNAKTVEWLQTLAEARSGTFPQITFEQLRDLVINVPSKELLQVSSQLCESWLAKIKFNHAQINKLEKIRDTLIPKLMTGEVSVQYQGAV